MIYEQVNDDNETRMDVVTTPTLENTPPTPEKLEQKKEQDNFNQFFNIFKGLYINILVIYALRDVLKYSKYLQEIVACKKDIGKSEK